MSLMKSLNSGISGLRAFQTKMDVIGNNIANVDTIGFKSSRVTFSEMLSQQISSGQGSESSPQSGAQVGLGVRISAIDRDFNQGGLQTTGRQTDIAIEGDGFFMVNDSGQNMLTRAGNFSFNREGLLVDQSGRFVQGFNADESGNILAGGTTENIRIDFDNNLSPEATQNVFVAGNFNADTSVSQIVQSQNSLTTNNGEIAGETTELNDLDQVTTAFQNGDSIDFEITNNDGSTQVVTHTFTDGDTVSDLMASLNTGLGGEASATLVDGLIVAKSQELGNSEFAVTGMNTTGTGEISASGFQITQSGNTGTQSISTTVFDELGRAHSVLIKLTQEGENSWRFDTSFLDGEEVLNGETGVIEFDESGNLISDDNFGISFDPGNGAAPVAFSLNLGNPETGSRITQFSGSSSARITNQDGFTEGELVDFNIDGSGNVNGIFSNGKNVKLAQVAVGTVSNNEGLETVGNGLFRSTVASGDISINTADNMASTNMAAGVLEGSNVDLAKEFTDMITSQRAYQSNARVITTADELLAEAVSLKR